MAWHLVVVSHGNLDEDETLSLILRPAMLGVHLVPALVPKQEMKNCYSRVETDRVETGFLRGE